MKTEDRSKLIEEHIMECFDNDRKYLVETINANLFGDRNLHTACNEVVQGGCLLVYYYQAEDFLKELECKLSKNQDANWAMYKKLVVNRMEKMYAAFDKEDR